MADMKFSPDEWRRVGRGLQRCGDDVHSVVGGALGRVKRPIEGADAGATIADMAVAVICPMVGEALGEMLEATASTLQGIGEGVVAVGDEYQSLEEANAELAGTIVEGL